VRCLFLQLRFRKSSKILRLGLVSGVRCTRWVTGTGSTDTAVPNHGSGNRWAHLVFHVCWSGLDQSCPPSEKPASVACRHSLDHSERSPLHFVGEFEATSADTRPDGGLYRPKPRSSGARSVSIQAGRFGYAMAGRRGPSPGVLYEPFTGTVSISRDREQQRRSLE
jgi:hypothetical protein